LNSCTSASPAPVEARTHDYRVLSGPVIDPCRLRMGLSGGAHMPPFLARDQEKGVNPTMVDTTMRARPRGRHKKGFFARLGAKATSMLSIGAILGAGMVGMVSTASADDESRTITPMAAPGWSDNAGHYMGSGEGYFVGNFNGPGGTTWLC